MASETGGANQRCLIHFRKTESVMPAVFLKTPSPPIIPVPDREPRPDPEPKPGTGPDVVPPTSPEPEPDGAPDVVPPEPETEPELLPM
jgi:hypothetical protein